MQWWKRCAALVVLVGTLGAPLGVVAEGYVCASGMRMDVATVHACSHCRPLPAGSPTRQSLARACCTYVGSVTPPQAVIDVSMTPRGALARVAPAPGFAASVQGGAAAPVPALASTPARHPGAPPPAPASLRTSLRL